MWDGVEKPGSPTARLTAPGTPGVRSNMRRMSETGTALARALTRSGVRVRGVLAAAGAGARDDGDLDEVVRRGQARLDGRPGGGVRLVEPPVPGRVHAVVVADVRHPHVRPHDLRLVA